MQFATDPIGHARRGRNVRVAVDDGQDLALVLGSAPVLVIDHEVLAGRSGCVATGHVAALTHTANDQPAAFARMLAGGVCGDGPLQAAAQFLSLIHI